METGRAAGAGQRVLARVRAGQIVAAVRDRNARPCVRGCVRGRGVGPCDQRDTSRRSRGGRRIEAGQDRVGRAVGDFIAIGEQQHELAQRRTFGQDEMRAEIGRRGIGHRGVIDRDGRIRHRDRRAERSKHDRPGTGTRRGPGPARNQRHPHSQAQAFRRDRGAAGQRDGTIDVDIQSGAERDIAIRGGDRRVHIHILTRVQQNAAVCRRQRRIDIRVASAADDNIAIGRGDRGVDIDVAVGVHRQSRRHTGRSPGNCIVDDDIAVAGRRGGAGHRQRADDDTVVDQFSR